MFIINILVHLVLIAPLTSAEEAPSNFEKGNALYDLRDFSEDGIANVNAALLAYGEALAKDADTTPLPEIHNAIANAQYFLGTALSKKKEKIAAFEASMNAAEKTISSFGLKKTHELSEGAIKGLKAELSPEAIGLLTRAMYYNGISLSQWGNLKGFLVAINRLDEVIGNMENIEKLGQGASFQYGPLRTVGRIRFVLPGPLGGNLKESESLLKKAYKNTLAVSENGAPQKYSVNGYNNFYLAETLYKRGKKDQAKKILELFLAADPATLAPELAPENRQAIEEAKRFLKDNY